MINRHLQYADPLIGTLPIECTSDRVLNSYWSRLATWTGPTLLNRGGHFGPTNQFGARSGRTEGNGMLI